MTEPIRYISPAGLPPTSVPLAMLDLSGGQVSYPWWYGLSWWSREAICSLIGTAASVRSVLTVCPSSRVGSQRGLFSIVADLCLRRDLVLEQRTEPSAVGY
jgi:hypothetical protein